jgi:hypothetical protein
MPDSPATRVPLPCPAFTVVTNGEILATVLTVDEMGRYTLEDAHTSISRDDNGRLVVREHLFALPASELQRNYRVVRWPDPVTELRAA